MDTTRDQMQMIHAPDARQLDAMRRAKENGNTVIASKGTDNYELWCHLVESGYMTTRYCPNAFGCHQFELTAMGLALLEEHP